MPLYEISAPNGLTYRIEGPEGATQNDVIQAVLAQHPEAGKPAPKTTVGGYLKETLKAVPRGLVGGLEQAALGAAALLPGDTESGFEKTAREAIKSTAEKFKPTAALGYEEAIPTKLGEALGSMGSIAIPGGIGGMAARGLGLATSVGRLAAGAAAAGGMGAGEAREKAVAEGATPEQITTATLLGTPVGLLELAPIEHIFSKLPHEIKAGIFDRVKRALVSGGFEGAQEAASAVAQNLIAQQVYKPNQQLIEGVGEQAAYGVGAGAIAQFLLDAVAGRRASTARAPTGQPATPPATPTAPAATPAVPVMPTTQAELGLETPEQPPVTPPQPVFAPSGKTYTPEELEMSRMQAESRERKDIEAATAEDQLRDLRNVFDIYQKENQRLEAAFQASTDPQERVDLRTKAMQVAGTLEQLEDRIDALTKRVTGVSRPGSPYAGRTAAEAGQEAFDFAEPEIPEPIGPTLRGRQRQGELFTKAEAPIPKAPTATAETQAPPAPVQEAGVSGQMELPVGPRKPTKEDLNRMKVVSPQLRATLSKLDLSTPEGYTGFVDAINSTKAKLDWPQVEQFFATQPRPEGVAGDLTLAPPQLKQPKQETKDGLGREAGGKGTGVSVSQPPTAGRPAATGAGRVGAVEGAAALPAGGKKERPAALKEETEKQKAARLERETDTTEADITNSLAALDQPISQDLYNTHLDYLTQTPEAAGRLAAAGVPKSDLEASKARVAKLGKSVDAGAKARAVSEVERLRDEISEADYEFNRAKEEGRGAKEVKALEQEIASLKESLKSATKKAKELGVDLRTKRVGIRHIRKPTGKQTRTSTGPVGPATGNTTTDIVKAIERIMRPDSGAERITTVVQSVDQLPEAIRQSKEYTPGVRGVAYRGRIWMVADNIKPGTELGVFLHEAGAHIGFDKVLKPGQREFLANQVRNWAKGNDLKGDAARAALAKGGTSNDEIVAYAVEELVNRGVKPVGLRPENTWLKRVLDVFKSALKKLGLMQDIAPQELVNAAFGAAHIAVKTPVEAGLSPEARFSTGSALLDARIQHRSEKLAGLKDQSFTQRFRELITSSKARKAFADKFRVHVDDVQATVKNKLLATGEFAPLLNLSLASRSLETAVTSMLHGAITLRTLQGSPAKVFGVQAGASLAGVHRHVQNIAKRIGGGEITKENFTSATRAFDLGAIALRFQSLPADQQAMYKIPPEDLAAGAEALSLYGDDIRAAMDEWTKYKNGLLQAAKAAGRFSEEDVDAWSKAVDFVPWYRKLDDAQFGDEVHSSAKRFFNGLQTPGAIKELMGGDVEERPIGDILNNMEQLSFWLVNITVRNHAAVQTVDALKDAQEVGSRTAAGVDSSRVIRVYRDGEQKLYEMADVLDAYAFMPVQEVATPFFRAASKVSNVLRKGTTLMPGFVVSQVFQDAFRVTAYSGVKSPFKVGAKTFSEFIKAFSEDDITKTFASYGLIGQPDYIFEDERSRLRAATDETKTGMRRVASAGFKALDMMTRASDLAQRRALFQQVKEETGNEALALYKASEIINFQLRGKSPTIAMLRQMVPFVNAYIQGMSVALRSMMGSGIGVEEKRKAMTAFYWTAMKIGALSTVYAFLVGDDDEYKEAPDHEKLSGFMIPGTRNLIKEVTGSDPGGNIRIPAPMDAVGLVFKALPEIAVNVVTKDGTKDELDATKIRRMLSEAAINALSPPNVVPQIVKPTTEVLVNKSFFTGRPIVGMGLENREKEQQFTASTSTLARVLGQYMPLAPVQIDHLMRGYLGIGGGTIAWGVSNMLDATVATPRPSTRLNEIPQIRTFLTGRDTAGMKEDYYELREKASKVNGTVNLLVTRDPAQLQDYIQKNRDLLLLQKSGVFGQVDKYFSAIRKERDRIDNADMSAEDKRAAMDRLDRMEVYLLSQINLPGLRKLGGL